MNYQIFGDAIKTVITFTAWAVIAPLTIIVGIPFALLPAKYRYTNRLHYTMSYLGLWLMTKTTFIKFTIKGKENLPTYLAQPSIVACNHTSAIDIPLVQALIGPRPHVWFIKVAYAKIPLFGFFVHRMHILVCRESTTKCANTIDQAHTITNGRPNHILIFPEGMRHRDGKIHRFFSGFVIMAQELNRPVIPIVVRGLHEVFPKNSFLIRSTGAKVNISIGQPMWYTAGETRQEFANRVHAWFVRELETL